MALFEVFVFGMLCFLLSSTYGYNDKMASFPVAYPTPILRPNIYKIQPRLERPNLPKIIFLKQLLELQCLKKHMKNNNLKTQNSEWNNDFARRRFLVHRKVGMIPKEVEKQPEFNESKKEVQDGWKSDSRDRIPQTYGLVQPEKKVPDKVSNETGSRVMLSSGSDDRLKKLSQHVWYEPRPDKIRPYKVEEVIEENVSVRIDNDDVKEATKIKKKQEQNIINESIRAILKGLISGAKTEAALKRTKTGKNIVVTEEVQTVTPVFSTRENTPHKKNNSTDKQTIEEIGFRSLGLINETNLLEDNRMKIKPEAQKTAVGIPIHRQQTLGPNSQKILKNNILTTVSVTQNTTMSSTGQPIANINTSTSITTTVKMPTTVTISTVQKSTSNFSKYFRTKPEKAETPTTIVKTELPSTESIKPRSTSRFSKYFRTRKPDISVQTSSTTSETTTETTTTTTTMQNFYRTSGMSDVLSKLTTPTYKDINDYPMTVDLLETTEGSKRSWQNTRKMHGDEDINRIVQTEQRRSDILITDYDNSMKEVNDAGYLDMIKQNTTSAIFSYIPAVISDLRHEKIAADDKGFLSETFGKYWRYITWLSNQTNLDMLPLMTIKNENDFESVIGHFNLEDQQTTVTVKQDNDQVYDYIEEYKDLYKDVLGQDLEEKKEIRKFRPKRHDDISKEYFESIEEEQDGRQNDYVYEDIMYNDYSAGDEDSDNNSILELMKIADFYLNVRNLSSRVRQK